MKIGPALLLVAFLIVSVVFPILLLLPAGWGIIKLSGKYREHNDPQAVAWRQAQNHWKARA